MAHSTEHWFTFGGDARESRKALLLQGASVSLIAYDAYRDLYVFDEYESRDELIADCLSLIGPSFRADS